MGFAWCTPAFDDDAFVVGVVLMTVLPTLLGTVGIAVMDCKHTTCVASVRKSIITGYVSGGIGTVLLIFLHVFLWSLDGLEDVRTLCSYVPVEMTMVAASVHQTACAFDDCFCSVVLGNMSCAEAVGVRATGICSQTDYCCATHNTTCVTRGGSCIVSCDDAWRARIAAVWTVPDTLHWDVEAEYQMHSNFTWGESDDGPALLADVWMDMAPVNDTFWYTVSGSTNDPALQQDQPSSLSGPLIAGLVMGSGAVVAGLITCICCGIAGHGLVQHGAKQRVRAAEQERAARERAAIEENRLAMMMVWADVAVWAAARDARAQTPGTDAPLQRETDELPSEV